MHRYCKCWSKWNQFCLYSPKSQSHCLVGFRNYTVDELVTCYALNVCKCKINLQTIAVSHFFFFILITGFKNAETNIPHSDIIEWLTLLSLKGRTFIFVTLLYTQQTPCIKSFTSQLTFIYHNLSITKTLICCNILSCITTVETPVFFGYYWSFWWCRCFMNYTNVLEYALANMFLFYFETTAT